MPGESLTLTQEADQARRENRSSDARRLYGVAIAICREARNQPELVRALKGLGQIERDAGHFDTARAAYEEAVAICRDQADSLALAHTVRHLGDIHRAAGAPALAEPHYREAVALYRGSEQRSPLDLANALRPLAIVEEGAGRIDKARELWKEARDLYSEAGVQDGVAESTSRLARLESQQ